MPATCPASRCCFKRMHTDAPGAALVVIGDLTYREEVLQVAHQVNALGCFDAVIHNAAVGDREPARIASPEGLAHVFSINTLAP